MGSEPGLSLLSVATVEEEGVVEPAESEESEESRAHPVKNPTKKREVIFVVVIFVR